MFFYSLFSVHLHIHLFNNNMRFFIVSKLFLLWSSHSNILNEGRKFSLFMQPRPNEYKNKIIIDFTSPPLYFSFLSDAPNPQHTQFLFFFPHYIVIFQPFSRGHRQLLKIYYFHSCSKLNPNILQNALLGD